MRSARPIPAATVTLQNRAGKNRLDDYHRQQGHFIFKAVAVGTYAMVANKMQFKPGTAIVSVTKTGAKPVSSRCRPRPL